MDVLASEIESQPDETAYMPCKDYDNNSSNYEEIQLGDDKRNSNTIQIFGINLRFKWRTRELYQQPGETSLDAMVTCMLCDKKVPIRRTTKQVVQKNR